MLSTHMFTWLCAHLYKDVHVYGGLKLILGAVLDHSPSYRLRQSLTQTRRLQTRLVSQLIPGAHFCSSTAWDYRQVSMHACQLYGC